MPKIVRGKTIRDERVNISAAQYVNCKLEGCVLVFDGTGEHPINCRFANCTLEIEGPAVRTVQFLNTMAAAGAWPAIEALGIKHTGRALKFTKD